MRHLARTAEVMALGEMAVTQSDEPLLLAVRACLENDKL